MIEYLPRPCDRCGAGSDSGQFEPSITHPMCQEFQLAYGVVAYLCFECRSQWHKVIDLHEASDRYSEAKFKLEFWQAQVSAGSPEHRRVEDGLRLWKDVRNIEEEIRKMASRWLRSE